MFNSITICYYVDNYSCYYLTDPEESSPIKVSNPNPYGGWDSPKSSPIHYAPYDMYPIIKWVEILDDQISEGIIRIHYNSWNSDALEGIVNLPMISMNSYSDYFDRGIYGYENGVLHSKNPTIINHIVGTGPYVYQGHNDNSCLIELDEEPPHKINEDALKIVERIPYWRS